MSIIILKNRQDFPGSTEVKNPSASAGDAGDSGLIPGSGRSPGGGNGNPFQCCCLENSMDRGARQATVRRVIKSCTQVSTHEEGKSRLSFLFKFSIYS